MQHVIATSLKGTLCCLILVSGSLSNSLAQEKAPADKPGSTGTVTFTYLNQKTTLATVRAKDGNIWLQQNLGSQKVAQSFDDKEAYGDLFQWGRWDDGHQVRQPVNSRHGMPTPNNPSGISAKGTNPYYYDVLNFWWLKGSETDKWDAATPSAVTANNGCDPCKALGAGWRLPTIDEWQTVFDKEDITDINGSMRSNLKLPAAGLRDYNGYQIAMERGSGWFWSSEAASTQGRARLAIVGLEHAETTGNHYRTVGLSIRCLKALVK